MSALAAAGLLALLSLSPALAWSGAPEAALLADIAPPPPSGSAAEKAELASLKAFIAENATRGRLSRAKADGKRSLEVFLEGMGIDLPAKAVNDLHDVIREARRTLKDTTAPLKSRFDRARPFRLDRTIHVCAEKEPDSQSFPSAHAAFGAMTAELLVAVAPEKKAAFRARGRAFGESRNVCGLHFLSDVTAGGAIGRHVAARLLQDPDFRRAFDPAAAAFRKSLGR